MTSVRESQVKDLVAVFSQCLNLHTGDTIKQPPELSVPGHRRWHKEDQELVKAANRWLPSIYCSLSESFRLLTWVSWYRAWYAIVTIEQLLPKELISGNSQPLSAGQTSSQHSIMGQQHEDLQHQAIWQRWHILHPNILRSQKSFKINRTDCTQFIYVGGKMWVIHLYWINKTDGVATACYVQTRKSFSLLRSRSYKKLAAPPLTRTNFSLKSESCINGEDR